MARKAKKSAAPKRKKVAPKRKMSAKKAAVKSARPADIEKQIAALKKRVSRIMPDLDSPDAARAKRAAAELDKLHSDLAAWAKKNGLKLVTHAVAQKSSPGLAIPGGGGPNPTHSCANIVGGTSGTKVTVCFFRRYSHIRRECLYACVVTDTAT